MTSEEAYSLGYREGFASERPNSNQASFNRREYIDGYAKGSADRDSARLTVVPSESNVTLFAMLETMLNDMDVKLAEIQEKRRLAADALAVVKDRMMRESIA